MADEEWALLRLLDGRSSWHDVLARFQAAFPQTPFSPANLLQFLTTAANNSLLSMTGPGGGDVTFDRAERSRRTRLRLKPFSLLTHRFRGIDPTRLLGVLDRAVGWVFSAPFAVAYGVALTAMTVLLIGRLPQLAAEVPRLSAFLTADNAPFLLVAIVGVKVLHELGHALACRRFGGECHELGVLLVGPVPLLYCDVTDSWTFPSAGRRIVVAAAGILVELALAAACGLLWSMAVPGASRTLLLNVFVVCSLNTLLVNGNPLLKYDGYYVLSDLLGVPNLGPESRRAAVGVFDRLVLGVRTPRPAGRTRLGHAGLVLFGVASGLYRFVVLGFIVWAAHTFLEPYGLESIAVAVGGLTGFGMLMMAAKGAAMRTRAVVSTAGRTLRAAGGLAAFGLLLAWLLLVPIPDAVRGPCVVSASNWTPLYVSEPGTLVSHAAYGDGLAVGDVVTTLRSADLDAAVAEAEGELAARRQSLRAIEATRSDAAAAAALPTAEEAVRSSERRLAALRDRVARLVVTAPHAGRFVPPADTEPPADDADRTPRSWSGRPLDGDRTPLWLGPRTLLGSVAPPTPRVRAFVPQAAVGRVRVGSDAVVAPLSDPAATLAGVVVEVASSPIEAVPRELAADLLLPVDPEPTADGRPRPEGVFYAVEIELADAAAAPMPPHSAGRAAVRTPPRSLARRALDFVNETFAAGWAVGP